EEGAPDAARAPAGLPSWAEAAPAWAEAAAAWGRVAPAWGKRRAPKKVRSHSRVAYQAVTTTVVRAEANTTPASQPGAATVACRIASLLQNPASGGRPTRAPSPMVRLQKVTGIGRRSPPMAL